jgi:hypothetical protein
VFEDMLFEIYRINVNLLFQCNTHHNREGIRYERVIEERKKERKKGDETYGRNYSLLNVYANFPLMTLK